MSEVMVSTWCLSRKRFTCYFPCYEQKEAIESLGYQSRLVLTNPDCPAFETSPGQCIYLALVWTGPGVQD